MKRFLNFAGKNGAIIVIAGVLIGILFPVVASSARAYLTFAIFVFTFGSLLKLNSAPFCHDAKELRRILFMALWAIIGVPAVIFVAIAIFKPGPDLTEGLLFWSLVPTSPACVAFAAMLNLNTGLALIATVLGTALAPFLLPTFAAALGGYQIAIDPYSTSFELVVIVGGALAASLVVRRYCSGFLKDNPEAMTGVAVVALFVAGLGSMKGMQAHLMTQPATSLEFIGLAYGILIGFELLGSILFLPYGTKNALTAGLISGTRTITLAWVVLGDHILPMADLFLASSMIAKYTAPGLTKLIVTRLLLRRNVAIADVGPKVLPTIAPT